MSNDAKPQATLFDMPDTWEKDWVGMPDYFQVDQSPHRAVNVLFRNREDVAAFFKLIGQPFTPDTIAVWFPKPDVTGARDRRWSCEPPDAPAGDDDGDE